MISLGLGYSLVVLSPLSIPHMHLVTLNQSSLWTGEGMAEMREDAARSVGRSGWTLGGRGAIGRLEGSERP